MTTLNLGTLSTQTMVDLRGLKKGWREANQVTSRINSDLEGVRRTAAAVFGGLGLGLAAREALRAADAMTSLSSRIGLVTDSERERLAVQHQLIAVAQEARQSLEGTAELFTRIALNRENLGRTNEELLQFVELTQKLGTIGGSLPEEMERASLQLSQGLALGTVQGQDLKSVMSQMPAFAKQLSDALGVSTGELKKMAAQGELTADTVIGAILRSKQQVETAFASMQTTVGQSWQQVKNAATAAIGEINKKVGATKLIVSTLEDLREGFGGVATAAVASGAAIGAAYGGQRLQAIEAMTAARQAETAAIIAGIDAEARSAEVRLQPLRVLESYRRVSESVADAEVRRAEVTLAQVKADYGAEAGTIRRMRADIASGATKRQAIQEELSGIAVTKIEAQETLKTAEAMRVKAAQEKLLTTDGRSLSRINKELTTSTEMVEAATEVLNEAVLRENVLRKQLQGTLVLSAAQRREEVAALQAQRMAHTQTATRITKAEVGLAAAQKNATAQASLFRRAMSGVDKALAPLGGPVGAAMVAAAGVHVLTTWMLENAKAAERMQAEADAAYSSWAKNMGRINSETGEWDPATMSRPAIIKKIQELFEKRHELYAQLPGGPNTPMYYNETSIEKLKRQAQELTNKLKQLYANLDRAPATAADAAAESLRQGKLQVETAEELLGKLREQREEQMLVLQGREEMIPQMRAQARLQEMINEAVKEQGLSEEEAAAVRADYVARLDEEMGRHRFIETLIEEKSNLTKQAAAAQEALTKGVKGYVAEVMKAVREAAEGYRQRAQASVEIQGGYDDEIQKLNNVLGLSREQAEIENRMIGIRRQLGDMTDAEVQRVRALIREWLGLQRTVESSDMFDRMKADTEQKSNVLMLGERRAEQENAVLEARQRLGELMPAEEAHLRAMVAEQQMLLDLTRARQEIEGALTDGIVDMIRQTKSWEDALRNVLDVVTEIMLRMLVQRQVEKGTDAIIGAARGIIGAGSGAGGAGSGAGGAGAGQQVPIFNPIDAQFPPGYFASNAAGANIRIELINKSGTPLKTEGPARERKGGGGERVFEVAVVQAWTERAARGAFDPIMGSRYGARPKGAR